MNTITIISLLLALSVGTLADFSGAYSQTSKSCTSNILIPMIFGPSYNVVVSGTQITATPSDGSGNWDNAIFTLSGSQISFSNSQVSCSGTLGSTWDSTCSFTSGGSCTASYRCDSGPCATKSNDADTVSISIAAMLLAAAVPAINH